MTIDLDAEFQRLHAENARLQRSHDRYEYLRRLTPRQFADLYQANLRGKGAFDDLVDRRIEKKRIEIEKANNEANGIRGGPIV